MDGANCCQESTGGDSLLKSLSSKVLGPFKDAPLEEKVTRLHIELTTAIQGNKWRDDRIFSLERRIDQLMCHGHSAEGRVTVNIQDVRSMDNYPGQTASIGVQRSLLS